MRALALTFLFALLIIPSAAPVPQVITCAAGQTTWLSGRGTPRTPLLVYFDGRVVSGGSINAGGAWSLPLIVGRERPGLYLVDVRSRTDRALIGAFQCAVGVIAPTPAPITPTPDPLNTGGADRYNCEDFTTWVDANAAFQANLPGDPNRLDNEHDGIPCEELPGAPAR